MGVVVLIYVNNILIIGVMKVIYIFLILLGPASSLLTIRLELS